MTADQLRRAEDAFRKAYQAAEGARETRNDLVRAALNAGWTHQRIAEVTGLSRGRISQIRASCGPRGGSGERAALTGP